MEAAVTRVCEGGSFLRRNLGKLDVAAVPAFLGAWESTLHAISRLDSPFCHPRPASSPCHFTSPPGPAMAIVEKDLLLMGLPRIALFS